MRKREIEVLRGQMESASKWLYRAVLMSKVLEYLGYNTTNIMQGDKDILADYVYREPAEIIHCLQMEG